MKTRIVVLLLLGLAGGVGRAEESIWIEGEDAAEHCFKKHGWYDNVDKSLLSGGEWLSHYDRSARGEATYKFDVREGGAYTWWLRCNVSRMTQHYQLDGGGAVGIGRAAGGETG